MAARILLVDDSPTILNLLSMMLKSQGYDILTAENGIEALKIFNAEAVDLLITDINMPRMDGYMLIASLRARERGKKLPIIVLTTQNSKYDHSRGVSLGVNLFLNKPISHQDLIHHVEGLLQF